MAVPLPAPPGGYRVPPCPHHALLSAGPPPGLCLLKTVLNPITIP